MATYDLEDRLESAIRHINTSIDIDPWAQSLAVESMRIRIAMLKTGQPEIIHCRDCKHRDPEDKKCDCGHDIVWQLPRDDDWFCADAERREDV